ncbi:hypothetical protein GGF32_006806 [Allomyces javanicus]|nr:hypothetical protein GGF32_006806 [Allomyces javanicus]
MSDQTVIGGSSLANAKRSIVVNVIATPDKFKIKKDSTLVEKLPFVVHSDLLPDDRVFRQKLSFVLQHFENKLKTPRTVLGPFTINAKPVAELPSLGNLHPYPRSRFMMSSKVPNRDDSMASVFETFAKGAVLYLGHVPISFDEDIDFVPLQRTKASAHAKQGYESPSELLKLREATKPSRMV